MAHYKVYPSYLNQLQHSLCIKIPDGVKSFSFLAAQENTVNGDGLIDTEDDPGEVEQEEHDDGGNKNHRMVDIIILITQSPHLRLSTFRTICFKLTLISQTVHLPTRKRAGNVITSLSNTNVWYALLLLPPPQTKPDT